MAAIKFVGGVLLLCLVRPGASNKTVASPCCEDGRVLDVEQQKCVLLTEEFVTETYAEETEATDPHIRCSNGWANFTTVQRATGALIEPRFNKTLTIDEYCIHSVDDTANETTILHCQPEAAVINKCCPDGYAVNRTSVGECVPTKNTFNASLYVKPAGYPFTLQPSVPLKCDNDFNVYLPNLFKDHKFQVLTQTNELYVERAMYKVFRNVKDYCIDSAIQMSEDEEPIAVTCLPWRMYIVRYIMWGIFPYTQFFSGFLMLITLLVYVSFPTLRNNLQGKAMICFLLCMVIVQIEYGALLALPTEPHTWCYFKLYVSTYFRYASSTWITVMGFLIWRQVTTPRGPKKNLWLEFLLLSIYAWGLPLILNLVVFFKQRSLGSARICWFSNPTIRLLMHMPNVVLVTLNLIFFIPSVIKVYGSLKFLRESVTPVTLSKIERQRITTIFRFFLLMQFYTIPRIVHEVVDLDAAGPEYVVFSVTLYQLIGPAMFYFFVCKAEVFRMVMRALGHDKLARSLSAASSSLRSASSTLFSRSQSYTMSSELPAETKEVARPVGTGSFKVKWEDNAAFVGDNA